MPAWQSKGFKSVWESAGNNFQHPHGNAGSIIGGCMVVWLYGCMVVWLYGCMVVWLYGCMVVWLFGYPSDHLTI
jgi:hypothetical protein